MLMHAYGDLSFGPAARIPRSDTSRPPRLARPNKLTVLLYPKHALIPSPNPVQREAVQAEV